MAEQCLTEITKRQHLLRTTLYLLNHLLFENHCKSLQFIEISLIEYVYRSKQQWDLDFLVTWKKATNLAFDFGHFQFFQKLISPEEHKN